MSLSEQEKKLTLIHELLDDIETDPRMVRLVMVIRSLVSVLYEHLNEHYADWLDANE